MQDTVFNQALLQRCPLLKQDYQVTFSLAWKCLIFFRVEVHTVRSITKLALQ